MNDMTKLPLPAPTSELHQGKQNLDRHGVVVHENALSAAECQSLLAEVLEQAELEREQGVAQLSPTGNAGDMGFAPPGAPAAPFQSVSFLPNKGASFRKLMRHPLLRAYGEHLFRGVPFYMTAQTATIVRNGAQGQVVHTDQQAWPFLTPVPIMFVAIFCLTDFRPEMGSTVLVPGTQHGAPPKIANHPETGRAYNPEPMHAQAIDAKAGSLLLWESRLWHAQGSSTSTLDRVGILHSFAMHMVRPQDDLTALIHDDVYEALTDEEKRVLGFEVHFEYAGRIGPRYPGDRRSNLNFKYPFVPELRRGASKRAVPLQDAVVAHAQVQAELVRNER